MNKKNVNNDQVQQTFHNPIGFMQDLDDALVVDEVGIRELVVFAFDINQTPALRRLSSLQSIWQLAGSVLPPACQGVMWSASMSSISKNLPHTGQIPFWRSYAERFWLHEKPLRFKLRSLRVST